MHDIRHFSATHNLRRWPDLAHPEDSTPAGDYSSMWRQYLRYAMVAVISFFASAALWILAASLGFSIGLDIRTIMLMALFFIFSAIPLCIVLAAIGVLVGLWTERLLRSTLWTIGLGLALHVNAFPFLWKATGMSW